MVVRRFFVPYKRIVGGGEKEHFGVRGIWWNYCEIFVCYGRAEVVRDQDRPS